MPKINKIKLSGTSYDIQDSNASKTVTLTQAQYDALQTKDPNTFYIISDGETFDPSEKVDTSAFTAYSASVETSLSGKASQSDLNTLSGTVTGHTADTTIHVTASDKATWNAKSDFSGSYNDLTNKLSAGTNITIVDNVISSEGGGKAITGGTNISVTTGETADTINCTLNAKNGTGESSFIANGRIGGAINSATGAYATTFGLSNNANARASFVIGGSNNGKGEYSFVGGSSSEAKGNISFAFGYNAKAIGDYSIAFGSYFPLANNTAEVAIGKANVSHTGSTDADKTLFSVGNGINTSNRHNAFEIRQNGDIYLSSGGTDIKLQDHLGGGGITSGEVQTMIDSSISGKTDESAFTAHTADTTIHVTTAQTATWSNKQDALVSGTNIKTINNESILGSGNITIQGGGGSSVVELTQAQYDALTTIDPDTIYVITDAAGGDLSNYYTKTQINAMIGDIESLLAAI